MLRNMNDTQRSEYVCTVQQRIAELAREKPEMAFTSLAHLIDILWLQVAIDQLKLYDALTPLRGNVNTRLRKLDDGLYDAIILAAAGLKRLGLGNRIAAGCSASICCSSSRW